MIGAAILTNVFAWSAQVALVAVLCAPLPRLLRLPAHVQYGFWRLVLAACFVMPFVEPWRVVASGPAPQVGAGVALPRVFLFHPQANLEPVTWWPPLLAFILIGGCALRLIWVSIGWVRLRRLRALGETVGDELATEVSEMASTMRVRADVRWVRGLPQPATFGLRRAVVLVPDSLREHSPGIRRAVLAHELLHVQRRDAAMVLVEELIRAATWFNPAFWWLIARVRLAREGVVDELTVLVTGARQTYLDALLLLADEGAPGASSAFSRRRQLFYRVLLISREVRMTSGRFVAATAVLALALVATGWTAASAFPLQTLQPALGSQNPPTPPSPPPPPRDVYRNPPRPTPPPPAPTAQPWQSPDAASAIHIGGQIKSPEKIRDVKPVYPEPARAGNVQGVVIVEALIDRRGNVEEIHILRSIPLLDEAAVDAVSQWKFVPTLLNGAPVPVIMTMTINFTGQ